MYERLMPGLRTWIGGGVIGMKEDVLGSDSAVVVMCTLGPGAEVAIVSAFTRLELKSAAGSMGDGTHVSGPTAKGFSDPGRIGSEWVLHQGPLSWFALRSVNLHAPERASQHQFSGLRRMVLTGVRINKARPTFPLRHAVQQRLKLLDNVWCCRCQVPRCSRYKSLWNLTTKLSIEL